MSGDVLEPEQSRGSDVKFPGVEKLFFEQYM